MKDALVAGLAVAPVYVVVRDVLKGFNIKNDLLTAFVAGAVAFEVANQARLMEWYAYQKLHAVKQYERRRPPRTHSFVCPLAMDFAHAR